MLGLFNLTKEKSTDQRSECVCVCHRCGRCVSWLTNGQCYECHRNSHFPLWVLGIV